MPTGIVSDRATSKAEAPLGSLTALGLVTSMVKVNSSPASPADLFTFLATVKAGSTTVTVSADADALPPVQDTRTLLPRGCPWMLLPATLRTTAL